MDIGAWITRIAVKWQSWYYQWKKAPTDDGQVLGFFYNLSAKQNPILILIRQKEDQTICGDQFPSEYVVTIIISYFYYINK